MNTSQERPASLRAIDLFCGGGGSSWGARLAGIDVVAAFDCWDFAEKNHRENIPTATFHLGQLENVDLSDLRKKTGAIDLILASPECTSHSPARGKRVHSEESKNTAFQVTRFARELRPRWIVIENVVGMKRWSRYPELKAELTALGYNVLEQVLNSADFGVPQTRRRLFLLCDLKRLPVPTVKTCNYRRNIRSVIELGRQYDWTPLEKEGRAQATLARAMRGIKAMGSKRPFLLVYYGSDHAGGWQTLSRPLRTITTLDRFALIKPSRHGHLMRMLQVPELQRAMGMEGMTFPYGSRRQRIRIIGNAVCPPVMRAVLEQLTGIER